jgi:serine/threonine-protein kinase
MVGLLVLLVVGVGAAWALGVFSGGIAVPNVVGKPLAQATSAVTAAGLNLGRVSYSGSSVAGIADGSIVSQNPAAGSKVTSGTPVNVVVAGQQVSKVPDVTGQSLTQATQALQGAGFTLGTVTRVPTSTTAPDTVLSQTPAAGASAAHDSAVALTVAQAPTSVSVPSVVGKTQAVAASALSSAGFSVVVVPQSSSTVASGTVISQDPAGNASAASGSPVTITVSSGGGTTTAIVPGVVGEKLADAITSVTAAGFKVATVSQTATGTADHVTSQNPVGGVSASIGATVTLHYHP